MTAGDADGFGSGAFKGGMNGQAGRGGVFGDGCSLSYELFAVVYQLCDESCRFFIHNNIHKHFPFSKKCDII